MAVATSFRLVIGAILLCVAGAKVFSYDGSLPVVVLGEELQVGTPWVLALVLAEGILGILLIAGRALVSVCWATLLLLSAFAVYHIQLVLFGGAHKACGCLGVHLTAFSYGVPALVALLLVGTVFVLQGLPVHLGKAAAESPRPSE